MQRKQKFTIRGSALLPTPLMGAIIIAFMAVMSTVVLETINPEEARILIEPSTTLVPIDNTFTVSVIVESGSPTNVFAGEIDFDSSVLDVASISYNTSIADLWAEKPWYENGAGTINFAGGTTRPGGFTGKGELLTITFRAHAAGSGTLTLTDTHIFLHDGLGTEVPQQGAIDTIVQVQSSQKQTETPSIVAVPYHIVDPVKLPSTDLNNDGKHSIADVSIFMLQLTSKNLRSDFNGDGKVDTRDLSQLLSTK